MSFYLKLISFSTFFLFLLTLSGQNSKNYIQTYEEGRIQIKYLKNMMDGHLYYYTPDNKQRSKWMRKVKYAVQDGEVIFFGNYGVNRIQIQIIAYNADHVLAYNPLHQLLIYDRSVIGFGRHKKENAVIKVLATTRGKKKKTLKTHNIIKEYFKGCDEFLKKLIIAMYEKSEKDYNISFYNCGNSLDLTEEYLNINLSLDVVK